MPADDHALWKLRRLERAGYDLIEAATVVFRWMPDGFDESQANKADLAGRISAFRAAVPPVRFFASPETNKKLAHFEAWITTQEFRKHSDGDNSHALLALTESMQRDLQKLEAGAS